LPARLLLLPSKGDKKYSKTYTLACIMSRLLHVHVDGSLVAVDILYHLVFDIEDQNTHLV
jgi:hypothetical protein